MLNEAFLKQSSNFSGRPSLFVHESCWGKGEQIRYLRKSGFRKFPKFHRTEIEYYSRLTVSWLVPSMLHRIIFTDDFVFRQFIRVLLCEKITDQYHFLGLVIRDGKEALSLRSFIMSTIRQSEYRC